MPNIAQIFVTFLLLIAGIFLWKVKLATKKEKPRITKSTDDYDIRLDYPGQNISSAQRENRILQFEAKRSKGNVHSVREIAMCQGAFSPQESQRDEWVLDTVNHSEFKGKGGKPGQDERLQIIKFSQVLLRSDFIIDYHDGNGLQTITGNGSGSIVDPRHVLDPDKKINASDYDDPKPNYLWILTAAHCLYDDLSSPAKCTDGGEVYVPKPWFWIQRRSRLPWCDPNTPLKPNQYGDRFYAPLKFTTSDVFLYGDYLKQSFNSKKHLLGTDIALVKVSLRSDEIEYGPSRKTIRQPDDWIHDKDNLLGTIALKDVHISVAARNSEVSKMSFRELLFQKPLSCHGFYQVDDGFYGPYDDSNAYKNMKVCKGFRTDILVFGYPATKIDVQRKCICHLACSPNIGGCSIRHEISEFTDGAACKKVELCYGPRKSDYPIEFKNGHAEVFYTNPTSGGMSGGGVFFVDEDSPVHVSLDPVQVQVGSRSLKREDYYRQNKAQFLNSIHRDPPFVMNSRLKAVHISGPEKFERLTGCNKATVITPKIHQWMKRIITAYD